MSEATSRLRRIVLTITAMAVALTGLLVAAAPVQAATEVEVEVTGIYEDGSGRYRICLGDMTSLARPYVDGIEMTFRVWEPLETRDPIGPVWWEGDEACGTFEASPGETGGVKVFFYSEGPSGDPDDRYYFDWDNYYAFVTIPGGTCGDVRFFGVRGSGQTTGMGPQNWSLYQAVNSRLPGSTDIRYEEVDYTAAGVPMSTSTAAWGDYLGSIYNGGVNLFGVINWWAGECPDERLILSGYSQGAMVVHRTLRTLRSERPSIANRIDAAVLIADGENLPWDRTTRYGSAGTIARGVALWMPGSGASTSRFPRSWQNKVIDVCDRWDVVCNFNPTFHGGYLGIRHGTKVHTTHYIGDRPIQQAADKVVSNLG